MNPGWYGARCFILSAILLGFSYWVASYLSNQVRRGEVYNLMEDGFMRNDSQSTKREPEKLFSPPKCGSLSGLRVGGPGLLLRPGRSRHSPFARRNPGLKSETWATHSTFIRANFITRQGCYLVPLLVAGIAPKAG